MWQLYQHGFLSRKLTALKSFRVFFQGQGTCCNEAPHPFHPHMEVHHWLEELPPQLMSTCVFFSCYRDLTFILQKMHCLQPKLLLIDCV